MYECTNCEWKGEELSKSPLEGKCPVCGDEVKSLSKPVETKPSKKKVEVNFDLDGDGDVDADDRSLMAKGLASNVGKKPKKKPGRKKKSK